MAKRSSDSRKETHPVSFELLAPYNDSVALLGSWDDWKPIPMQRDDRGIWRVDVDLSDGDYEYKFQVVSKSSFALGETVQVADPKAIEHTLDSHENSVLRVRGGKPISVTYAWQHDDRPLEPNAHLIIYEMHIGDFRGGPGDSDDKPGTFERIIEKLDYLTDLGITAIELMPVNEFPGHHQWGYSLRSLYGVENSYGTPDELCRLVDECHARGIRVIHDTVYNHMEMEAPLTKIDYGYWFYVENPDPEHVRFGPKFNYEYYDENLKTYPAREHMIGALRSWVGTFHMDGLRFDFTRGIRDMELLGWFNHEVHHMEGFKPFLTVAEHIPQDPAVTGPDGPMDAAWHDSWYRQLNATTLAIRCDDRDPFNTGEVLRVMDVRQDGFASPYNTVHYLSTHDDERTMWALGALALTFDDAAFRRARLGATLLLTSPGLPMIWMGEEFGQPTPRSMERHPLQWNLLEQERNRGLHAHYKHLIQLRKSNPAITDENFEAILNDPERGLIGYKRWNDEGNVVVVVANLKPGYAGRFEIGGVSLEDGTWQEMIYNYEVMVSEGRLVDTLAESEAKVYIRR